MKDNIKELVDFVAELGETGEAAFIFLMHILEGVANEN